MKVEGLAVPLPVEEEPTSSFPNGSSRTCERHENFIAQIKCLEKGNIF